MKYKVVGWTDYEGGEIKSKPVTYAKYCALVAEIKEKGYFFSGEDHQDYFNCVPVFNDGSKGIMSRRGFAGCMADAHGYTGVYDYSLFTESMFIRRPKRPKYTPLTVDLFSPRSQLIEEFNVDLSPEDFEKVEKENLYETVSTNFFDFLETDDVINFRCEEKTVRKTVTFLDRDRKKDDEYYRRYSAMQNFRLSDKEREQAMKDFQALPVYLTVKFS